MRKSEVNRTLILGVGNVLLADEGVGIHVVRRINAEQLPNHIDVVDGGTGGFHLLEMLQSYDRIILIDAALDGQEPGKVNIIRPKFASDFPKVLSAHEIGLRDLIESLSLVQKLPDMTVITISISTFQPMRVKLSPAVQASIPNVLRCLATVLNLAELPLTISAYTVLLDEVVNVNGAFAMRM
ncbi:hydrogenase maturation protease [bacterium]|nr:hydrogenase maturation protease [bacterium]